MQGEPRRRCLKMESSKLIHIITGALNDALRERHIDGEIIITPSWERGPLPSLRKYILKVFLSRKGITGEVFSAYENVIGTDNALGYDLAARRLLFELLKDNAIWNSINTRPQ